MGLWGHLDLICFAGPRARFQGVWEKSLGSWRQGLGTLAQVLSCLAAAGKDLWMLCGLEKSFVESLWEIRVCGSLEEEFQGLRNRVWDFWGLSEKFGGLWGYLGGFTGIHDTYITLSEEHLEVFGGFETGLGSVL